ncbi:hypothetical protein OXYTRIMIC_631 [Oxytricha trifallax]|uniref:Endonuclease/exonuclease/phosphatase domain-containing protein n=1 Tax=Oxytricha trifallax TaxID=1172189 RepID=A0A073IAN5_9SPIT|nr:hypothetical protein OXYTRIMIC_631 [Oxytricha trifallax]
MDHSERERIPITCNNNIHPTILERRSKNVTKYIGSYDQIKQKCQRQIVIAMGDFNFPIKDLGKTLNKEGLKESIPEGMVTHTRGNQLDQIFSNMQTVSWETRQLSQMDHKLIQVKLKIKLQESDQKLSDKERTIRF